VRIKTVVAGLLVCVAGGQLGASPSVEAFVRQFQNSFNTCDAALFSDLLAEDFSGFGVSGVLGQGRPSAVESFARQCERGLRYRMQFTADEIVIRKGSAYVAGRFEGELTTADGRTLPNNLRATLILVESTGELPWQLRHSHLSALR